MQNKGKKEDVYRRVAQHLDDLPAASIARFEEEFHAHLDRHEGALMKTLRERAELTDEIRAGLEAAIAKFKAGFTRA